MEERILKRSERELVLRDNELLSLISRTSILVAAATLLFAVFALKSGSGNSALAVLGVTLLVAALLMTAVGFITAIRPLAVPVKHPLLEPYQRAAYWSLLTYDNFTDWVMNQYQTDRKNKPITRYKKAHAKAVHLLVWAAAITIPGLALSIIFR